LVSGQQLMPQAKGSHCAEVELKPAQSGLVFDLDGPEAAALPDSFFLVDPFDLLVVVGCKASMDKPKGMAQGQPTFNEPPGDSQDASMMYLPADGISDASGGSSPVDGFMAHADGVAGVEDGATWGWEEVGARPAYHPPAAWQDVASDSQPASTSADESEKKDAMRKLAEKKQRERGSQKELLRQLDGLLPCLDPGEARQPRALTPSGRSVLQILEAASQLVRSHMAGVSSAMIREGMRRAGSMLVVEVEAETRAIRRMGRGMQEHVEAAPWYGELQEEVVLDLLVHPAEHERLGRYLKAAARSTNRVPCELFRMCRYRAEPGVGQPRVDGLGGTEAAAAEERGRGEGRSALMEYEVVRWKAFRSGKRQGGRRQPGRQGSLVLLVGSQARGSVCL